jgi:general secretion pathway protein A
MYTRYFGFSEKPFSLTPNPRFIFLSKNHKEAFAHLLYGINCHYGFIELIGEVGTGKTTVLRTLLDQFQDENYRCALIFNPCLSAVEMLRAINQEFGINTPRDCINDLLTGLNRFLLAENNLGRTVVLVIDEAQNLRSEVLEQLRLISNLETENDKLIQIILAGQPELETILRQRNLRQLNQRIAVRYKLRSMDRVETREYIKHRIEIAGATGSVSFSETAIFLIHLYSRGTPRLINILCDRSLLVAYGDERRRISCGIVIRAIRELLAVSVGRYILLAGLVAASVTVLIVLAGGNRFHGWPRGQLHSASPPQQQKNSPAAPTEHAQDDPQQALLEQNLLKQDLNDIHIQAFNAIMGKWNAQPVKIFKGTLKSPETFNRLAVKRNVRCTVFKGSLNDVIRFDLPFLFVTKVSGQSGRYCLAVTSVENDLLSVSPPLLGNGIVSKANLASMAEGTFYVFWRNSGRIPDRIQQGTKNNELRLLQRLLKQAGFYPDVINGEYNNATVKALGAFQKSMGISINNSMGELTLAALTKYDTSYAVPSLTRK